MELEQALELELCQEFEIHILSCYYRSNQWRKRQIKELFLFLFLQNLKNEIPVILIAFACKICRS